MLAGAVGAAGERDAKAEAPGGGERAGSEAAAASRGGVPVSIVAAALAAVAGCSAAHAAGGRRMGRGLAAAEFGFENRVVQCRRSTGIRFQVYPPLFPRFGKKKYKPQNIYRKRPRDDLVIFFVTWSNRNLRSLLWLSLLSSRMVEIKFSFDLSRR
jgi:hypothetical protein